MIASSGKPRRAWVLVCGANHQQQTHAEKTTDDHTATKNRRRKQKTHDENANKKENSDTATTQRQNHLKQRQDEITRTNPSQSPLRYKQSAAITPRPTIKSPRHQHFQPTNPLHNDDTYNQ